MKPKIKARGTAAETGEKLDGVIADNELRQDAYRKIRNGLQIFGDYSGYLEELFGARLIIIPKSGDIVITNPPYAKDGGAACTPFSGRGELPKKVRELLASCQIATQPQLVDIIVRQTDLGLRAVPALGGRISKVLDNMRRGNKVLCRHENGVAFWGLKEGPCDNTKIFDPAVGAGEFLARVAEIQAPGVATPNS